MSSSFSYLMATLQEVGLGVYLTIKRGRGKEYEYLERSSPLFNLKGLGSPHPYRLRSVWVRHLT